MMTMLGTLLLLFCVTGSAHALSIVTAEATLDWTGLHYTTTGTLTATRIDRPLSEFYGVPRSWVNGTPPTASGSIIATASTTDGFLAVSVIAQTTGHGAPNAGAATAGVFDVFWFYGSGEGSLVVDLPFHLEVSSVETDVLGRDRTSARVFVGVQTGPGVGDNADWWATADLALTGAGAATLDGVLHASRHLTNPYWGPLVAFNAGASAHAISALPEPATIVLLTAGLLLAGLWTGARRAFQTRLK